MPDKLIDELSSAAATQKGVDINLADPPCNIGERFGFE